MADTHQATAEKDAVASGTTNGAHNQSSLLHHRDYHDMGEGAMAPPFGGSLNPGAWKPYEHRKFANPAPLGLSAFALTTFVLSLINLGTRGVSAPNIVISLAFGYGGLVQLLAGMWEMAVGNTFGATALSSYGGFWIAYALLLSPPWDVANTKTGPYSVHPADLESSIGFFLTGWWIFTTILLICTLRSTVAFFFLFFTLDLAFLMLACQAFANSNGNTDAGKALGKTGGVFGLLAAFLAWYNALAGIQDSSNSFFTVPVVHFPWSAKAREAALAKSERATV